VARLETFEKTTIGLGITWNNSRDDWESREKLEDVPHYMEKLEGLGKRM
jgi:hypothetical protein